MLFEHITCPKKIICFKLCELQYEWHLVANLNEYIMIGLLFRENLAIISTFSFKFITGNIWCSKWHENRFYILQFIYRYNICEYMRIITFYYGILWFSARKTIIVKTNHYTLVLITSYYSACDGRERKFLFPC